MTKEKVIIFSHENDIDGLGNIILGKIAFGDIDYVLASNVNILEAKFRELLDKGTFHTYDRIYITDLALYNPSLEMVSKDPELSKKILVFDHHKSAINDGCDKYDFTTIMETDVTGIKRCGTDLFYDYLCSEGLITRTSTLDEFVELTRLEDTWEWKKTGNRGLKAHDLAILLNGLGIEKYIRSMVLKVNSNAPTIEFTDEEKKIVAEKKTEYLATLQKIWNEAEFFEDENQNRFAGVFADYEYRNELGEYVRGLMKVN